VLNSLSVRVFQTPVNGSDKVFSPAKRENLSWIAMKTTKWNVPLRCALGVLYDNMSDHPQWRAIHRIVKTIETVPVDNVKTRNGD